MAGDFGSLAIVRVLQGASAAGRDVGSLGLIAREAESRVASVFSWYSTAKHVGGVAGAAVAGLLLAVFGGDFRLVFAIVLLLAVPPVIASWYGVSKDPVVWQPPALDSPANDAVEPAPRAAPRERLAELATGLRALSGPAGVGLLIAAGASMVNGIFPLLATEYAGLSALQTGFIYSLSAVVVLIAGPAFGWLIDRHGRLVGIAWRSVANIGSSVLYLVARTFAGIAFVRAVDDSGKAAFRPAWAAVAVDFAAQDPARRGRRLGTLDTAVSAGEAIGPALAGLLWQTGGIAVQFGVRIVIAIVAEIAAMRVFGELRQLRTLVRPCARLTAVAYVGPPAAAGFVATVWLVAVSRWAASPLIVADLAWAAGVVLLGSTAGRWAGRYARRAEDRRGAAAREERAIELRHAVATPLTLVRGEVELILSRGRLTGAERRKSSARVIEAVERVERTLRDPSRTGPG